MLPFLRYCQVLALLLLLGACQRASYSFQAPGSRPAAPVSAPAGPAPAVAWLPAQPLPAAAARPAPARHSRRPRVGVPAQVPAQSSAAARPGLLRALAAARATRQVAAHQQPLPTDEPVRYRSRGIAVLLAAVPLLLLLPLGLHYFYLGYPERGALNLVLLAAAFVLLAIGAVGAFVGLFSGAAGGALTLLVIGSVIYYALLINQVVDVVRIAIGNLLPKNGGYYPRFFQGRPAAELAPPGR